MLKRTTLLALLAAALTAPADAFAADYVYLSLDRVRLANGWTLSGAVSSSDYARAVPREVVGVTLSKRLGRGATEQHALRLHPVGPTISFDGGQGRWRAASTKLRVDLRIVVAGAAEPVEEWLGCRGALARVRITLDGTFALRTATKAFGTVRRARFTGTVTYNTGGPVTCGAATGTCTEESFLSAYDGRGGTLTASPEHRSAIVSFRDGSWYHLVTLSGLDAVSGELPRLSVRLPQRGSGTFVAGESTQSAANGCRTTRTAGTFTGTFRVTFTGWDTYTFAARRATASYVETAAL